MGEIIEVLVCFLDGVKFKDIVIIIYVDFDDVGRYLRWVVEVGRVE